MRITGSSLSYAAVHQSRSTVEVEERLEVRRAAAQGATVVQAGSGRAALGAAPGAPVPLRRADGPDRPHRQCCCGHDHHRSSELGSVDPKLAVAIGLIERLTGVEFDVLDSEELSRRCQGSGSPELPSGAPGAPSGQQAMPTITYDRIERRVEEESLRFAAAARVTTGDGRTIDVELQLSVDRRFAEEVSTHVRIGPPLKDPLVVDLGRAPTAMDADHRVAFDLDADGTLDEVPWVTGGSAFLALDRNGNGVIDDGSELFGARTGDGFAELAALDDDRDGWLDEDDAAWSQLRLVDGSTAVEDTRSLAEAGVGAIAVDGVAARLTDRDASGDVVAQQREMGIYLTESGEAGTVRQVDLAI